MKDNDTFGIKISSWHSAVLIQGLTDLITQNTKLATESTL